MGIVILLESQSVHEFLVVVASYWSFVATIDRFIATLFKFVATFEIRHTFIQISTPATIKNPANLGGVLTFQFIFPVRKATS
jgi:hypothetical protein